MSFPRVLITCGPAHEPIDDVRRITNHSSGELGTILAETLAGAGFEVTCFRGEGSIHPAPRVPTKAFGTNSSLEKLFQSVAGQFDVVLHAAALCDFLMQDYRPGKISSHAEGLTISLHPAPKLIGGLRELFPEAILIGWKYELEGTRQQALEKARHQISTCHTNACVVNGHAYGKGFGFLDADCKDSLHVPDKPSLARFLEEWLRTTR